MSAEHRVEDYFAGVLEGEERVGFERHMESCVTCKDAIEALRRLDVRLSRELAPSVAAREPRREWLEQVKADLPAARRSSLRWPLPVGIATAAAIVAVIAFSLGASPQPQRKPLLEPTTRPQKRRLRLILLIGPLRWAGMAHLH